MNKILLWIIGGISSAVFTISVMIGTWWVNKVNISMEVVTQLQFKDQYLNGTVAAAPVAMPSSTPAPVVATPR